MLITQAPKASCLPTLILKVDLNPDISLRGAQNTDDCLHSSLINTNQAFCNDEMFYVWTLQW